MRIIALAFSVLMPVALAACSATTDDSSDAVTERGPLGKADAPGTCVSNQGDSLCGGKGVLGPCWCDDLCAGYGDCCPDHASICEAEVEPDLCMTDDQCSDGQVCDHSECLSNCPAGQICPAVCWGQCADAPPPPPPPATCDGHCGGNAGACWCDEACVGYGDCCDDYEALCTEPEPPPLETCEDVVDAFTAETAEVRACTADADCGQVLTGTSCGCTRNWVAAHDADLATWNELRDLAGEMQCSLPGMISTCDCPPADGFACHDGTCTWNYLP
jgi:hypothetical protein